MEMTTTTEQRDGWRERLTNDKQGAALRELRDFLAARQAELRRLLDAGSSPEEYAINRKLLAAMEAAENAAVAFWEKHNKE